MRTRIAKRLPVPLVTCLWLFAGCSVYDAALLNDPNLSGRDGGGSGKDAGDGPGDASMDSGDGAPQDASCKSDTEKCNGLDDDCDDKIDEDALMFCQGRVKNADTSCSEVNDKKVCVNLGCNDGFDNCDGDPSNGCEPFCQCNPCDDGGTEDSG